MSLSNRTRRASHVLALLAISSCTIEPPKPGAFYDTPLPAGAARGDLIRAEKIATPVPGATAFRVIYASSGLNNELRPVSAIIFVPDAVAPPGGRNVVAWAHPTTGVARRCAPSLRDDFPAKVQGLTEFLAAGDVVTATDYPGLGTPGPHPFLVGSSEGRAVLDSIRAARHLPAAAASSSFIVWGHSQGGHAALFAGEIAPAYAPELSLKGIAVAAPASDLAVLMTDDIGSPIGRILTAYTLDAWSQVYGAPLASVVQTNAMPAVARVSASCAEGVAEGLILSEEAAPLGQGFLIGAPQTTPPWRTYMAENNAGRAKQAAPLIIAQGARDTIVPQTATRALFAQFCRRGETVQYLELPETGHMTAAKVSAGAVAAWARDRFAGRPAPDDCKKESASF
jgi:alpha-beta hydrolase superfamily lysophospholipase